MKPGMDQTPEDVDELEEKLESLDPETDVRVSWGTSRSTSPVTIEGTTLEHDSALAYVRTDERKSDFGFRRRGPYEISVTAVSGNRNESTGWLVDVEVLDDQDAGNEL